MLAYQSTVTDKDLENLTYIGSFKGKTGWELGPLKKETSHCGFIAQKKYSVTEKDSQGTESSQEKKHFIVSIRGTRMTGASVLEQLHDWETNFNLRLIEAPADLGLEDSKAKVHSGFYAYGKSIFDSIWLQLRTKILEKAIPEATTSEAKSAVKISVYGHSLGGGGAHIVSLLIKKALKDDKELEEKISISNDSVEVFTYESPRAFNKKGAEAFDKVIGKENHIRVIQKDTRPFGADGRKHVWNTDPATAVPPGFKGFWYKHTGTLCVIYITKETAQVAGPLLHATVPIENAQGCLIAGKQHKSNLSIFKTKTNNTLEDISNFLRDLFGEKIEIRF